MAEPGKQQPIRWVRYRVKNVWFAHQLKMLNLPSASAATDAAGAPAPPPEVVVELPDPDSPPAGAAPAEEVVLELPDVETLPPPDLLAPWLLRGAAEIEHALLVQYLYAAYSLPNYLPTGKRGAVTRIAIEEMSHLMTVQNLLLLLGQPPHLGRQDFGTPSPEAERLFPFPLIFEPLSKGSLAKYIVAESPESADQQEPAVMAQVRAALKGSLHGQQVNRVGMLYAFLGVIFGDKQTLLERAAEGDEWYQMVNRLAGVLARIYGGRDKIHLPDSAFPEANPNAARQGTDEEWDRSRPETLDEFRVFPGTASKPLTRRNDALAALRDIGIQGEGASQPGPEASHFTRFVREFQDHFGTDGSGTDPIATHKVPSGAVIPIGGQEPNAITHPDTVPWAQLGNLRYALLLGFLEQYLVSYPADRRFLAAWTFAEMYHLKWLGGHLATLARSETISPIQAMAALPFTMPPEGEMGMATSIGAGKWPAVHAERLRKAIEICEGLLPKQAANTLQQLFLTHTLEGDRRKLVESTARQSGQTARTQFDEVRDILDWAAGTGSPKHTGSSPAGTGQQRRFWWLSLEAFKQAVVYGQSVVDPVDGAGSDSGLIEVLKDGTMPQGRPKLDPAGPEIAFIAQWIKDGCPDAPLVPPGATAPTPPAGSPAHNS